jgi:hypothetical protein
VADAQSLLAQAEVQDQLARIDVWRALLAQSVVQGTLTPFISLVATARLFITAMSACVACEWWRHPEVDRSSGVSRSAP